MLIQPPKDEEPEPIKEESRGPTKEYVDWFLNVPSWLCPACGITNFGRNKWCANWKCRIPKP